MSPILVTGATGNLGSAALAVHDQAAGRLD
jgi:uncharacterized protein YbjT (DUF2867 family)